MERPIYVRAIMPCCAKCGEELGSTAHLGDCDEYLCDSCWEDRRT